MIEEWIENYEHERKSYASFHLFAETKVSHITNFNTALGSPNYVTTAVAMNVIYNIGKTTRNGKSNACSLF